MRLDLPNKLSLQMMMGGRNYIGSFEFEVGSRIETATEGLPSEAYLRHWFHEEFLKLFYEDADFRAQVLKCLLTGESGEGTVQVKRPQRTWFKNLDSRGIPRINVSCTEANSDTADFQKESCSSLGDLKGGFAKKRIPDYLPMRIEGSGKNGAECLRHESLGQVKCAHKILNKEMATKRFFTDQSQDGKFEVGRCLAGLQPLCEPTNRHSPQLSESSYSKPSRLLPVSLHADHASVLDIVTKSCLHTRSIQAWKANPLYIDNFSHSNDSCQQEDPWEVCMDDMENLKILNGFRMRRITGCDDHWDVEGEEGALASLGRLYGEKWGSSEELEVTNPGANIYSSSSYDLLHEIEGEDARCLSTCGSEEKKSANSEEEPLATSIACASWVAVQDEGALASLVRSYGEKWCSSGELEVTNPGANMYPSASCDLLHEIEGEDARCLSRCGSEEKKSVDLDEEPVISAPVIASIPQGLPDSVIHDLVNETKHSLQNVSRDPPGPNGFRVLEVEAVSQAPACFVSTETEAIPWQANISPAPIEEELQVINARMFHVSCCTGTPGCEAKESLARVLLTRETMKGESHPPTQTISRDSLCVVTTEDEGTGNLSFARNSESTEVQNGEELKPRSISQARCSIGNVEDGSDAKEEKSSVESISNKVPSIRTDELNLDATSRIQETVVIHENEERELNLSSIPLKSRSLDDDSHPVRNVESPPCETGTSGLDQMNSGSSKIRLDSKVNPALAIRSSSDSTLSGETHEINGTKLLKACDKTLQSKEKWNSDLVGTSTEVEEPQAHVRPALESNSRVVRRGVFKPPQQIQWLPPKRKIQTMRMEDAIYISNHSKTLDNVKTPGASRNVTWAKNPTEVNG